MGDRGALILRAVELIGRRAGDVLAVSSPYESEPWGYSSPNLFINRAVVVETQLRPLELLDILQAIEKELGRVRACGRNAACADNRDDITVVAEQKSGPYEDRPIDIDIIFCGDLIIESDRLTVPHPLVARREFVLVPLAEIIPGHIHPVLGRTVSVLLNDLRNEE